MPKKAEISMSPALKAAVTPGTLGYDIWPTTEPSAAQKTDQNVVSKGWRMKSLNSAADSLLQAATRLEKEVKKETKYWEQVLSVSEKGWPVCRLTRESHTLGVQFGFSEGKLTYGTIESLQEANESSDSWSAIQRTRLCCATYGRRKQHHP